MFFRSERSEDLLAPNGSNTEAVVDAKSYNVVSIMKKLIHHFIYHCRFGNQMVVGLWHR